MLTANDFATLYGEVIDIDDLARVLGASRRETQAMLRAQGIEPTVIGGRQVVAAERAARALGLVEGDAEIAEVARVRRTTSQRSDGSPKRVHDYLAER